MIINTKFKVGDLIKRRTDQGDRDTISLMEVQEIKTDTCYVGTQIWYLCRPLFIKRSFKGEIEVHHGIHKDAEGRLAWQKYREDEVGEVSAHVRKYIERIDEPSSLDEEIIKLLNPESDKNDEK